MSPHLSILIVNWNTRQLLARCLESIRRSQEGLSLEILVVDNGSSDGSPGLIRSDFPEVRLLENAENLGFARANNQAIRASSAPYVLLLNSDTCVQPGALGGMLHFMERNPKVAILGAELLNPDGSLQPSWARFPTLWSEFAGKNVRARKPYPDATGERAYQVDWVGGACLMARREMIDQVGLLDEGYFMYSEEMDWCYRAAKLGWYVCYLPGARLIHLGGGSSRHAAAGMIAELYRSKLRFFARHYGQRKARLLGLLLQARFLGKALLSRLRVMRAFGRSDQFETSFRQAITLSRAIRHSHAREQ